MAPPSTTIKTLNPFAPEYTPIPPGVAPNSNAPLPFFLPPPPSSRPPPPPPKVPLSDQFFTYVAPTPHTNSNYHFTPQNVPPHRNSLPPPPRGRGSAGERRWLPPGASSRNAGAEKNGGRGFSKYNKSECSEKKGRLIINCTDKRSHEGFVRDVKNKNKVVPFKKDEEKTTVMIKNIPYVCSRKELISLIDNFCVMQNARNEGTSQEEAHEPKEKFICAYDFLYLPIDFRTKNGRGFAFVNFTNARAVWRFFEAFHLKNWDFVDCKKGKWGKKIEVVSAKIQGKEDLIHHFAGSVFECATDEYLPVTFDPPRDGSGQLGHMTAIGSRRASRNFHRENRYNYKPQINPSYV